MKTTKYSVPKPGLKLRQRGFIQRVTEVFAVHLEADRQTGRRSGKSVCVRYTDFHF
jgi:hypothetical protein